MSCEKKKKKRRKCVKKEGNSIGARKGKPDKIVSRIKRTLERCHSTCRPGKAIDLEEEEAYRRQDRKITRRGYTVAENSE